MRCIHASECGGCSFQHIPYAQQLADKEAQLRALFAPFGGTFHPIIGCDSPWEYRNKMEFSFSQDLKGNQYLGLMLAKGKRRVLNLSECHLVSPWFTTVLHAVRTWWSSTTLKAYHLYRDLGTLRTLTLREGKRTGGKMAMLTVSGRAEFAPNRKDLEGFIQAIRTALPSDNPSLFLRIQQLCPKRPTQFYEMHLGGPDHIEERLHLGGKDLFFRISPSSFFQPNTSQAEKLYNRALELVQMPETLFDLYCGTATFAIAFSPHVQTVTAVELSPDSLIDAAYNLERNQISNVILHAGDVAKVPLLGAPGLVIVDPPRAGLTPDALHQLLSLKASQILYVSCNAKTQAENLAVLTQCGYRLRDLQPLDQFPHTPHCETLALLTLSEN